MDESTPKTPRQTRKEHSRHFRETHPDYDRAWYARHVDELRPKKKEEQRRRRAEGKAKPQSPEARKQSLQKYNRSEKRKAAHARWYQKHKEEIIPKVRNTRIFKKWGITAEEYDRMMAAAECAACGSKEHLIIDHVPGVIRGILCDRCNKVLGLVKDDVQLLDALASYLELPR